MRTIDADALVNRIVFHTDIPSEYKEQVEDTISDMQTIETEPRWIPCSECERRCNRWENLKTSQE